MKESRKACDVLQVDKSALAAEVKEKDEKIKNLLEELKLTKEAGGDSVTQIGELRRDLRIARENSDKFENEAKETK